MKSTSRSAVISGAANGRGLSRRSVMRSAMTGIAAVITSPAIAKPAAAINPDAKLLALVEQYIVADSEYHQALAAFTRAEDQVIEAGRRVSRPDVLRWRPEDEALELPAPFDGTRPPHRKHLDEPVFWHHADVSKLARAEWGRGEKVKLPAGVAAIANAEDPIHRYLDPTSTLIAYAKFTPSPAARARADEIVAALEAEWKARKTTTRKLGLRKLDRELGQVSHRACRIREQIEDMPAHTLAGIMGKVRCVALHYKKGQIDHTGEGADDLAISIASDLARLGMADAAALAA